jgi:uncharacterized protein (TIGR04206 family)
MVWVKSEYAEELAVLAAWLSALVPWSISVSVGEIQGGTLVEVRFPAFLLRFLFGISVDQGTLFLFPWDAARYYTGSPGSLAFVIWTIAAFIVFGAVLCSLGLYLFEERLAAARLDPVRVMGVLLGLSGLLTLLASLLLQFGAPGAVPVLTFPAWLPLLGNVGIGPATAFPGIVLPIGAVLQLAFAWTLLRVERVDETVDAGSTGDLEDGPDSGDDADGTDTADGETRGTTEDSTDPDAT